jgi:type IV secretion system pilin
MGFMKRLLLLLAVLSGLLVPIGITGQAAAVDIFKNACSGNKSTACQDATGAQGSTTNPIITAIKTGIEVLSYLIGAAAVIGMVVSGIRFITANGDSGAIASARSSLTYSLVGIAIVAISQTLVAYVLDHVK